MKQSNCITAAEIIFQVFEAIEQSESLARVSGLVTADNLLVTDSNLKPKYLTAGRRSCDYKSQHKYYSLLLSSDTSTVTLSFDKHDNLVGLPSTFFLGNLDQCIISFEENGPIEKLDIAEKFGDWASKYNETILRRTKQIYYEEEQDQHLRVAALILQHYAFQAPFFVVDSVWTTQKYGPGRIAPGHLITGINAEFSNSQLQVSWGRGDVTFDAFGQVSLEEFYTNMMAPESFGFPEEDSYAYRF